MSFKEKLVYAALVLIGVVAFSWAFFGPSGIKEVGRLEEEGARMKVEIQKMQEKRDALAKETELMRSDPRIIERKARDNLGMVRPEETVIMIPGKKRYGD